MHSHVTIYTGVDRGSGMEREPLQWEGRRGSGTQSSLFNGREGGRSWCSDTLSNLLREGNGGCNTQNSFLREGDGRGVEVLKVAS